MHKNYKYALGLDVGVGSVGYALLKLDEANQPCGLLKANSVTFPMSQDRTGNTLASIARNYRSGRRLNRRRKFRKQLVNNLFTKNGLINRNDVYSPYTKHPNFDLYRIWYHSFNQQLSNQDLYRLLYYFVGHRAFKSNRIHQLKSSGDKDTTKLLSSIDTNKEYFKNSQYNHLGEMFYCDPKFAQRKHNKGYDDGYLFNIDRGTLLSEIKEILNAQSKFGNPAINDDFKARYLKILSQQRNFDDGPSNPSRFALVDDLGNIKSRNRKDKLNLLFKTSAKATYTFQKFQILQKLANTRYKLNSQSKYQSLDAETIDKIFNKAITKANYKYSQLKKDLKLPDSARFNMVMYETSDDKSAKQAETKTFIIKDNTYYILSKILSDKLQHDYTVIDQIAEILTRYTSDEPKAKALKKQLGEKLSDEEIESLLALNFTQYGSYSIDTMQCLIPYLAKGYDVTTAIDAFNEDQASLENGHSPLIDASMNYHEIISSIKNPALLQSFTKTVKVVKALIRRYGNPYTIHIEMARELSLGNKGKAELIKKQNENRKRNDKVITEMKENFPNVSINGENIIRLKLYHEQNGIDIYDGRMIDYQHVLDNNYEVDHILPYSISFNNSFNNKVLTSSRNNQLKRNRTPYEWLHNDKVRWDTFTSIAENVRNYPKKNNLLKMHYDESDMKKWKTRSLNDTRYATRLLYNYFKHNEQYFDAKPSVMTMNGSMTAQLRYYWGIVKQRAASDKHHAVDACVIAACSNSMVNLISKYHTAREKEQLSSKFPMPWPDFRNDVMNAKQQMNVKKIFSHSIAGKVNEDGLKGARYINTDKVVVLHEKLANLKLKKVGDDYIIVGHGNSRYLRPDDLTSISNRNSKNDLNSVIYDHIYNALSKDKKAFEKQPYLEFEHKGHKYTVRRVKVISDYKGGVILNRDADGNPISVANRGKMVRNDIFKCLDKKKRVVYRFVPIYEHQILDTHLPNQYARFSKNIFVNDKDQFICSLSKGDAVEVKLSTPKKVENCDEPYVCDHFIGYFDGSDIRNDSLNINALDSSCSIRASMSKLISIQKCDVTIFGSIHKVHEKVRQPFNLKHK